MFLQGGKAVLYEKLNQQKKKMGITTEQLSRLSGVPVGTINKILRGETKAPRYDTLQALEKVLFADSSSEWKENGSAGEYTKKIIRETAEYFTKKQGEYTIKDYQNLPEDMRAELIDGTLTFSEAPDFTHQELVAELIFEFKLNIRKKGGACRILSSPLDVQLDCDDKTMVQPDISLICKGRRSLQLFFIIVSPLLHCVKDRAHGFSQGRQGIFYSWGHFRIDGPRNDPILLHGTEAVCQDFLADSLQIFFQFVKPPGA